MINLSYNIPSTHCFIFLLLFNITAHNIHAITAADLSNAMNESQSNTASDITVFSILATAAAMYAGYQCWKKEQLAQKNYICYLEEELARERAKNNLSKKTDALEKNISIDLPEHALKNTIHSPTISDQEHECTEKPFCDNYSNENDDEIVVMSPIKNDCRTPSPLLERHSPSSPGLGNF
jgi:hypothetical protein